MSGGNTISRPYRASLVINLSLVSVDIPTDYAALTQIRVSVSSLVSSVFFSLCFMSFVIDIVLLLFFVLLTTVQSLIELNLK